MSAVELPPAIPTTMTTTATATATTLSLIVLLLSPHLILSRFMVVAVVVIIHLSLYVAKSPCYIMISTRGVVSVAADGLGSPSSSSFYICSTAKAIQVVLV